MKKKDGPIEVKSIDDNVYRFKGVSSCRNHSCKNYNHCLNLAASLDWQNFECSSCTGNIDERIIWRAKSAQKQDPISKKICTLPKIECIVSTKLKKIS